MRQQLQNVENAEECEGKRHRIQRGMQESPAVMLVLDYEVCHMCSASNLPLFHSPYEMLLLQQTMKETTNFPAKSTTPSFYFKGGCLSRVCRHILLWEKLMVMLDAHLSFTDDEEGVSSGSLSNDVLSIFIMCLSGKKATEERFECAPFSHPQTNICQKI